MNQPENSVPGSIVGGWKTFTLARIAFVLGSVSVLAAIMIGLFSFEAAVKNAEKEYQRFYMHEARMLVAVAGAGESGDLSDEQLLARIRAVWGSVGEKPADEYICIVDNQADLILHTAHPETEGNSAGANQLAGTDTQPRCSLQDLVGSGGDYLGHYTSSSGQDQIAAFRFIPERQWTLGVHRSREALRAEVRSSMQYMAIGIGVVCGLLFPGSFLLLFFSNRFLFRNLKRSEEALKASEERFRDVAVNVSDWIWEVDAQGVYTYCSEKSTALLGYTPQELIGKTPFDLMTPEQTVTSKEFFADVLKERRPFRDHGNWNLRKDGTLICLLTSGVPVFAEDGTFVGYRGSDTDFTEIKQEKEAVRQAKEDWESTFESLTDMVTIHDENFNIIRANRSARQTLNLPLCDDFTNGKCFMHYHGTECPPESCTSCQALRTGQPNISEVFEPHLNRYLEIRAIPRFDSNHRCTGLVHVVRDITERKHSEKRIHQLAVHLETVREEERKRLSRELHDDIGQILTALKIDLMMLEDSCVCGAAVKGRMGDMKNLMSEGIQSVHSLCRQLRPGALDDLNLEDALAGLVDDWQQRNETVCELCADVDDEALSDDIKTAIFRMVQEALTNVSRYANASCVKINLVADTNVLNVSIADNGRGMATGAEDKLMSFGLLGMHERIEALGGKLTIESTPDKGTQIEVSIPLG